MVISVITLVASIPVVVVHGGHMPRQCVGPARPPACGVEGGVGAGEVLGQRGAPLRRRTEHALQRRGGRGRGRRQHHLASLFWPDGKTSLLYIGWNTF